jgi:hypothetical protein
MKASALVLRFSRLTVWIALLASSAVAQTRMGGFAPAGGFGHIQRNRIVTAREHRAFNPAYSYYGTPYFYSDYYEPSDLEYQSPPSQPPPPAQVKSESSPLPGSVLLELHGTRWVRVTNFGESSDQGVSGGKQAVQPAQTKVSPPAILVYRDGHTEEVSSYSIIGGLIYTKANYWTTGAWTRTIAVFDLDIPATLSQNEKRGVNFELPSGPDEVMLRP